MRVKCLHVSLFVVYRMVYLKSNDSFQVGWLTRNMSWRTTLRQYALHPNPEKLPNSIRFSHNDTSLSIFDCYPKSIFHFLVLPRSTKSVSIDSLADLQTLLRSDKIRAKAVLLDLKNTANDLRLQIEKEMVNRYGFKWEIWTGFHAVPSMLSVLSIKSFHLRRISIDLSKGICIFMSFRATCTPQL
jgi:aprataxin